MNKTRRMRHPSAEGMALAQLTGALLPNGEVCVSFTAVPWLDDQERDEVLWKCLGAVVEAGQLALDGELDNLDDVGRSDASEE